MDYQSLKPKEKRIVESQTSVLFSPAAFMKDVTIDDIKRISIFHPHIKIDRNMIFLSEKGVNAWKRISFIISTLPRMKQFTTKNEVSNTVLKIYQTWLSEELHPTGEELLTRTLKALEADIKEYNFLIKMDGIELKDNAVFSMADVKIFNGHQGFLEKINFQKIEAEDIYKIFKDSIWLMASTYGSHEIARQRFENKALLIVGTLSIAACTMFKGALRRSRIRAVLSPMDNRGAISLVRWDDNGGYPMVSRRWGNKQDISFKPQDIEYLNHECFLQSFAELANLEAPSELQQTIIRSVICFADANLDTNITMQFVKLWSCVECFFALDQEGVTEQNAKGIAAILAFAGYQIIQPNEYSSFKKRLKKLYDLRSKAIHRAMSGHIENSDLDDLSRWVAWVVISMVTLANRGYRNLRDIREQIERIDTLIATQPVRLREMENFREDQSNGDTPY